MIPSASILIGLLFSVSLAAPARGVNSPHGTLALDCSVCHTEESWRVFRTPEGFDHRTTGFPLEGLHRHVPCRDCHRDLVFTHVGTRCADCHDDFHKGRVGPSCEECHAPDGWTDQDAMRRRHDETILPLVGAHERVDCDACHTGPAGSDFAGTPADCFYCHAEQYQATTSPPHGASGLGTDCITCHGVFSATWGAGDFLHPDDFPLAGGHGGLECTACHTDGFTGLSTACASCHLADYNGATDPDHVGSNFPLDCTVCHQTTAWEPATIDHSLTAFPLTGAHIAVDCASCHTSGYTGTATDCQACHLADYNGATDPDHVGSNFPLDCTVCHQTTAWEPATIDHSLTAFPLTGAHTTVDCASCHTSGYTGTATDCQACHLADYNAASNPPHAGPGFPLDCATCHTTNAWAPSTFNHEILFPILSGPHSGAWNSCADCHVIANDFLDFECIYCHEHNQTDMDSKHREVGRYEYLSVACYACHPRGSD